MRIYLKSLVEGFREQNARRQEAWERTRQARDEQDRLRAELSHLEHEIYDLWKSNLPRSQKALLEAAIRVRCRQLEDRIWDLNWEMQHAWDRI